MSSLSSLLSQIEHAKSKLANVETRVVTTDGREMIEKRHLCGFTDSKLVGVRPYGFVGDLKPDLQMAEVSPGLFLGGQDPAHDMDLLDKHSITHIVNLASNVENRFGCKYTYLKINLLDLPCADIKSSLPTCLTFIHNALVNGRKVFVHCNAGVSRSAAVVIAYLMRFDGLTLRQAYDKVRSIRPCVRPNEGFWRQLQAFEDDIYRGRL